MGARVAGLPVDPGEWPTGRQALGERGCESDCHKGRSQERGQALVETALVLPMLLFLALGLVGVGRVTQAQMGVSAVAREAARVATLASNPNEALARAAQRGQEVGLDYGLTNGSLQFSVDAGSFARGGQVQAQARYVVSLADLPLLGGLRVPVESHHAERIDLYQSRWP